LPKAAEKSGTMSFNVFLQIAAGSASELDYKLLLAKDLGYITEPDYSKMADELSQIRKMLASLLRKVNVQRKG
jgi:four helix bundle protein